MTPDTFARFSEILSEATLLVDGNGLVLTANRAAGSLLGCRPAELVNRTLGSLTNDSDAVVADLLRLGSRSAQRLLGTLHFQVVAGRPVATRVELAAIKARQGDEPAWVSLRLFDRHEVVGRFLLLNQRIDELSKEISRRRDAEAKLEIYSQQLVEAGLRKDEFLAMLAHELRNPLAPMTLGVDLLQSLRAEHPKIERVADMMRRQLSHLKRLVDDLLDVARLTHRKIELHKQPLQLDDVVGKAVEMFRSKAEEHGLHLRVDNETLQVRIDGDAVRLVQVFGNLLSNAIKFSRPGGEVSIGGRRSDGEIVVSVRDDGAGISPELLPQVFELFVQADRSLDRLHGGLGVGLAVVRTIVEMHGGRVAAESAGLGCGTELRVWLPLMVDEQPPAAPPAAPPAMEQAVGAASEAGSTAAKMRVLVVEDNADAAEAMRDILVEWGHEAVCVGDGPAALALWPEWQPDVGLFDIGLPGMSGHELARVCRPLAGGRSLLMLALSGYGSAADLKESRDAGFDDHLVKPVDLDRLSRRLASHAAALEEQRAG
ncbi:ATP-binding protein [Piscinibacter sakaiensis]|uniref:ATP-binding protein n=1 Tax=Piscinibacter sakaiensis TaxID=1547922 RepID=UPI003AB04EC7